MATRRSPHFRRNSTPDHVRQLKGTGGTRISLAGGVALPRRLAPRKRPAQNRSQTTVEAILAAAAELFATRGYARTNTNHVAVRAGVSVGSLYQYFPNKDAILTALVERHLDAVDVVIRAGLADLANPDVPLRQGVRHMLERLLEVHDANPGLTRAVETQVGQVPRIPEAFRERKRAYAVGMERALRARPDVREGNLALMAQLLFEVAETASAWLAHAHASSSARHDALDEATEVISRYVERRPGG
jgi:AcrR family transcriptional regulator